MRVPHRYKKTGISQAILIAWQAEEIEQLPQRSTVRGMARNASPGTVQLAGRLLTVP